MPDNSILKRTVFYEKKGEGAMRFADWALVTTTLGVAVEPFTSIGVRSVPDLNIRSYDPTEDCSRVDEMRGVTDLGMLPYLLSGGQYIHGGALSPRVGR
jgi:hypothetical protein